jgi:hypothetical protein
MSDRMRWRYGNTNPVVAAVDSSTVIEIGDLLWQDTDDAKPAAALNLLHSANPHDEQFKWVFLGVAMQRTRTGDTAPIRVATTGVFEFDCTPAAFELGDMIGVETNMERMALCNQVVKKTHRHNAIGRVTKRQAITENTVLVDICSTVMTGGV